MNWFITIFLAQFLFGSVFSIELLSTSAVFGSAIAVSGSSTYCGLKRVIKNYYDEDVGQFKPAESILKEAVVGDLIEFNRTLFNHWAIYIGDGKVADPSVDVNNMISQIISTTRATVVFVDLIEVADKGYCRVNNKIRSAENRGLKPRSAKVIMELVGKSRNKGFDYNIIFSNCEHKVTEWKFGLAFSDQVAV
jgi:hypothetical protein